MNIIDQELVVKIRENLLLSAAMFNNVTLIWRKLGIDNTAIDGETKNHQNKCQPSDEFLF